MRLILYIGHHKVGSTALQAYLAQNSLKLLQNGILYPPVESQGFAHLVGKALNGQDEAEFASVNIREPHSALAYKMMAEAEGRKIPAQFKALPPQRQMLLALRNQVTRFEPETVVLASEAFANFGGVAPDLINVLRDLFPEADLQVYCALRRPDQYLVSWHGQRLKAGEALAPLRKVGISPYSDNVHFRFDRVIEPWINRCPKARICLRSYNDILATGGSIEDFTAQTGLDLPDHMLPAPRANKSLPLAAVEIARLANAALEPKQARILRRYLIDDTGDNNLIPNRDVEMFGAANRTRMMEEFAPVHDSLCRAAGVEAFFPDLDDMTQPRPVAELDAMADTLGKIDADGPDDPQAAQFLRDLKQQHAG